MADIIFIKDTFSGEKEIVHVKSGRKISHEINKHLKGICELQKEIEIYNATTGETIKEIQKSERFNVLILVNGIEETDEYVIKNNDIIVIVVIPMSKDAAATVIDVFAVAAAFAGVIVMALTPVGWGTAIGLGLMGIGVTLAATKGNILDSIYGKQTTINKESDREKKNIVQFSDADNESIIGKRYSFVLGKYRSTPYVCGASFNTIQAKNYDNVTSANEISVYNSTLYCVGYSPLKITELKYKEDIISHNDRNIVHGRFQSSDILKKWDNNDINVEILQKGLVQGSISDSYGSIYDKTIIDDGYESNLLFIHDGLISDHIVQYKNIGIANQYRTNVVKYSRQCPKSIKVELDCSSGLYATRTITTGSENKTVSVKYYKMPVVVAVQWRFHRDSNVSPDAEDGFQNSYQFKINGNPTVGDVITVDSISYTAVSGDTAETMAEKLFELIKQSDDYEHYFVSLNHSTITFGYKYTTEQVSVPSFSVSSGATISVSSKTDNWKSFTKIEFSDNDVYPTEFTSQMNQKWLSMALGKSPSTTHPNNNGWIGADVFTLLDGNNYNDSSAYKPENYYVDERKYSLVYDFTPLECLEMIRELTQDDVVSSSCIEIRAIRLTPAYLNQNDDSSSDDKYSNMTYQDLVQLTRVQTICFDKDELKETYNDAIASDPSIKDNIAKINQEITVPYLRPATKEDLNKFCYIAIKQKQDISERGVNSGFNVIAQSFSPYLEETTETWIPQVNRKYKYYHVTYDAQNKRNITYVTEQEYNDNISDNSYHKIEDGNNYNDYLMNTLLFRNSEIIHTTGMTTYKLPSNHELFTQNNTANIALLSLIGSYAGKDALCYDDIDMVSLSDLKLECDGITDGSIEDGSSSEEVIPLYANGIVREQIRVDALLSKILATSRSIFRLSENNKIQFIMGKPNPMPTGVITSKNCNSITHTKYFDKYVSGLNGSYIDEGDGYNQNEMTIPYDGEDYKNPTREFIGFNSEFITNAKQFFSIARYNLAINNMQSDLWSCSLGKSGKIYSVGDTVVLREDTVELDGKTSARIIKMIEDTEKIYGFIIDDAFTYIGQEDNGTGLCKQGCSIVQMNQSSSSRMVTLRFPLPTDNEARVTVDGIEYIMDVGITNTILFKNPIKKDTSSSDDDNAIACVITPKLGNLVLIGNVGEDVTKCIITDIKNSNNNISISLTRYNEDVYHAGTVLPRFDKILDLQNFEEFKFENTSKQLVEMYTNSVGATNTSINNINGVITNSGDTPPNTPSSIVAYTDMNGIYGYCTPNGTGLSNSIKKFEWQIKRDDDTVISLSTTGVSFSYNFIRSIDGYPTKNELSSWNVRVRALSIYDIYSEWSESWS